MDARHSRYFLIAAGAAVLALWLTTPWAVTKLAGTVPKSAGEYGDMFGMTNALFSGLALIGIVAAIFLQQQELRQSTTELRNSATALTKQVELAADTARIQTLPILIELQKMRAQTYGGPDFKEFTRQEFNESWIRGKIADMARTLEQGPGEIAKLQEEIGTFPGNYDPVWGGYDNPRYVDATRELDQWKKVLTAAESTRSELIKLLEYMNELVELYEKMKKTTLVIQGAR